MQRIANPPHNPDMPSPPRIHIEREFSTVVRKVGGDVVSDLLKTKSPPFDNADYLFRSANVVAELKCLDKNTIADPQFLAKLSSTYSKLVKANRAPPIRGRRIITLADIAAYDQRAAFEFVEPFKQRLRKVVIKANKQIRETAKHFNIPDSRGLLVLANDGDLGFEIDMTMHLLDRLFRSQFSSIDSVLYFTANVTVNVPGFRPSLFWAPVDVPGRSPVGDSLLEAIRAAWMNHMATLTGGPVLAKLLPGSPESTEGIRFTDRVRPHLRFDEQ